MANEKTESNAITQEFYLPPPQLSKWESFKLFLYDKERGEVMGRTGASWAKIGLFYLVFYSALAAFFAVMLVIFYQTLSNDEPKWRLDSSLIGTNPGLGFRPMPDDDNVESTLIWFRHGANGDWEPWVNRLQQFLDAYEDGRQEGYIMHCDWNKPPTDGKSCHFSIKKIKNCTKEMNFGYHEGHPCILIKMNRIFDWAPVAYNTTNYPSEMPQFLIDEMKKPEHGPSVWLSCEGETPADIENMGPISYTPYPGFPAYYFPYKNKKTYLAPFVFVEFLKPTPGVLISIECKAWAMNIEQNRAERRGSVHFELLMD